MKTHKQPMSEPPAKKARKAQEPQRINYFITWHAPYPEESALREFFGEYCEHYAAQEEVGEETQREHLQVFLGLKKQTRTGTLRKLLQDVFPECNKLDLSWANDALASWRYCHKEETRKPGGYTMHSNPPKVRGQRTDLERAADHAKEYGIRSMHRNYPDAGIRYGRSIMHHLSMLDDGKKYMPIKVFVFWGKTGTGKTRSVPDGAGKVIRREGGQLWFDACIDRKVIWIDEMAPGYTPIHTLLQVLDVYRSPVDVRGIIWYRDYEEVYITSNYNPDDWYPNALVEQTDALKRRFTEVRCFDTLPPQRAGDSPRMGGIGACAEGGFDLLFPLSDAPPVGGASIGGQPLLTSGELPGEVVTEHSVTSDYLTPHTSFWSDQ